MKLIFSIALTEFSIMCAYEYFVPLNILIRKNSFLGPIIDTFILVLIISIAYIRMLKRPLDELVKVMNAVEKKDFSREANERRKDEFGVIATHFNKMSQQLKNWGRNLEQEVQTRTGELNVANEGLKAANEELTAAIKKLQFTAKELRQANEELKALKQDLEKRVEERIAETTKAKQELEKKVIDLERFNKFSVDREMKMVELKKEIEALKVRMEKVGQK